MEKGSIIIKKTFAYQKDLPSLPIPRLNGTQTRLLEWIEPLVSKEQFQETIKVVNHFFEKSGAAEKLQEKLYAWDNNREGSWLKPFWDDLYLTYRGSLPTGSNFNILLENKQYENRYTTSELAGKVCYLVTEFYHAIMDEEVEPATMRGTPLDMEQYKKFFRSVRIPKLGKDEFRVASFDKKDNHIVILYKNNAYQVHVTTHEGNMYQSKEIAAAIETVFQEKNDEGLNMGIFTTAKRDDAANVYEKLIVSKVNAETLQTIADSLVVISIDEESESSEEAIKNMMLNGTNKYFDKTIQIIITKNGDLGFNIEHTAVDGTTVFSVIEHVSDGLANGNSETVYTTEGTAIEKMKWEISEELRESLTVIQKDFLQTKESYHVESRIFDTFGSDEIKKMRISPDAFFHMALQIAQYRTFGVMRSVYEPVSVRTFYQGRTECARATSWEKVDLVKALDDEKQTNEKLYALMQEASAAHAGRIGDCRQGLGVERHMYSLEQMYYKYGAELGMKELPAIFTDKGYLTMRHDFISTSGMAYANVKYRIFGPVVEGGFGLAYILLDAKISINISSKIPEKEEAKKLMEHLMDALHELSQIAKDIVG